MNDKNVIEAINNSPLVKAAVLEAVHRYYYDRVLQDDFEPGERELVNNLHTSLWNLQPDWRNIIHQKSKRYFDTGKNKYIPMESKPIKRTELFTINITYQS